MADGKEASLKVGVAGWSYPDWQDVVYPSGVASARDHLRYLAGFVDVIEINTTFYHPPEIDTVMGWCDRVADIEDFTFAVKLWRRFTHSREEHWQPAELQDFLRRVRPVFDRGLGGVMLAQFPHSFHHTPENMTYLQELLRQIEDIPVVVEVRHDTWNNPEAFAMLKINGAGLCSIDQPMFRGSLAPVERVTGDIAYIRLHGRNKEHWFAEEAGRDERYNYLYSDDELEPWIKRARKMAAKAREVYVIANNHFRGQAVCNALMLKAVLRGERVRAPAVLLEHFPELRAHADPDAPVQEKLL